MIDRHFKYAMLLSSLPVQPANLFSCRILPISRIRLDKRLSLLEPADAEDLIRIEGLLHWSKMSEWDDATIVAKGRSELALIRSEFLRSIVAWRLELRTLLTALRRRHAGETLLPSEPFCGFGDRLPLIRRNWQKPDFGLGHALPWIKQADRLMGAGETLELDKLMLDLNWQYYARLGLGHNFDFPAVVLYVLRWYLINRWVSYDRDGALLHFDELINAGMAGVSLEFEENHERT